MSDFNRKAEMNLQAEKQKQIDRIMAIKDPEERRAAIAQNMDLFEYRKPTHEDYLRGTYLR